MYEGFKSFHSSIAYLTVLLCVITMVYTLLSFFTSKIYSPLNKKFAFYTLIAVHLQILLGLILYFISPNGISAASSGFMKDATMRFQIIEHPLTMIIAAVLITIGYSKSKRQVNESKGLTTVLIYFGIGVLLILLRIPWNIWPALN